MGTGKWHPATDNLAGTSEYGVFKDDPLADGTFSKKFNPADYGGKDYKTKGYGQFLFASGDATKWMIVSMPFLYNQQNRQDKRYLWTEKMTCMAVDGCTNSFNDVRTAYGSIIDKPSEVNVRSADKYSGIMLTLQSTLDVTYDADAKAVKEPNPWDINQNRYRKIGHFRVLKSLVVSNSSEPVNIDMKKAPILKAKNHPTICKEYYVKNNIRLSTKRCKWKYVIYQGFSRTTSSSDHWVDKTKIMNHVELRGVNVFVRRKPSSVTNYKCFP